MGRFKRHLNVLALSASIFDLTEECMAAQVEWNQKHDREKLKVRASNIIEKAADVADAVPNPYSMAGAKSFKTAYRTVSYAVLAYHATDAARAAKMNFDMNRDAQVFLLKKVQGLNSNINYKQRELEKCERFITKN